jgi:hypothetical protein
MWNIYTIVFHSAISNKDVVWRQVDAIGRYHVKWSQAQKHKDQMFSLCGT